MKRQGRVILLRPVNSSAAALTSDDVSGYLHISLYNCTHSLKSNVATGAVRQTPGKSLLHALTIESCPSCNYILPQELSLTP